MPKKILNETICLKKNITINEYKQINELQQCCSLKDKVNLKLELDYKLNMYKDSEIGLKNINEFLYYVDNTLVAYLGISSFSSNIGEINGMTHPDFRRKGLFKKLFNLAFEECKKRKFDKLLLLSDGKSNSGIEFIKSIHGIYDFSEYRMKLTNKIPSTNVKFIDLKVAEKSDKEEIAKQNAIFFGDMDENEEVWNQITYLPQVDKKIIGKIKIDYNDDSAFICGFGILPEFRGKGYGKATLKEILRLLDEKNISNIELDVECKNSTALNLYTDCGFQEKAVMNYYFY